MDLESFRKLQGLSQEQAAAELGLRSKGYISRIESRATPCPLRLALQIEEWSGGKVPAETLLDDRDRQLLRANRGRAEPTGACA